MTPCPNICSPHPATPPLPITSTRSLPPCMSDATSSPCQQPFRTSPLAERIGLALKVRHRYPLHKENEMKSQLAAWILLKGGYIHLALLRSTSPPITYADHFHPYTMMTLRLLHG